MSEKLRYSVIIGIFLVAGLVIWQVLTRFTATDGFDTANRPLEYSEQPGEDANFNFNDASPSPPNASEAATTSVRNSADIETIAVTPASKSKDVSGPGKISGTASTTDGNPLPPDLQVTLHFVTDEAKFDASIDTVIAKSPVSRDGKYTFDDLPLGVYTLFGNATYYTGTVNRTLSRERPEGTADLTLYEAAYISGSVINREGTGIPDAHIFVAGYLSGGQDIKAGLNRSRTSGVPADETGRFTIGNLQVRTPALQYRLIAMAPGYAPGLTDMQPTGANGVAIVLESGSDVSGTVINGESEEPVPNVGVVVSSDFALNGKESTTDENGAFVLAGLPSGTHTIGIVDKKLVVAAGSTKIEVLEAQPLEDIIIEVLTGGIITGRVYDRDTDAGISGVEMDARPSQIPNAERLTVKTAADGTYRLEGLHSGTYRVIYRNVKGYNDRRSYEQEKNIVATAGQTISNIDFSLSQGLTVSGIVVNADNQPVEKVRVSGQSRESNIYDDFMTEKNGRFIVAGFKPNSRVSLRPSGDDLAGSGETVELGNESIRGVRLVMVADAKISGVVVNPAGRPVPGTELYATRTDANDFNISGRSDGIRGDGSFTISRLSAGEFAIKQTRNNMYSSSDKALVTVTVREGEHKKNVRIVLDSPQDKKGTLTIAGNVVDDLGQPVSGAVVASLRNFNDQIGASTNANGNYTITGLHDRAYSLNATRTGYRPKSSGNVQAGSSNINFVLERTGTISGRVIDGGTNQPVTDFSIFLGNPGSPYRPGQSDRQFKTYHHEEGAFEVENAFAGTVSLRVRSKGYADVPIPVDGVRSGETKTDVLVRMETENILTGMVTNYLGQPVRDASVHIGEMPENQYDRERAAKTTTDINGSFTIDALPRGETIISAYATGYVQDTVTVNVGPSGSQVNLVLGQGGTLQGYVTLNGTAMAEAQVYGNISGENNSRFRLQGRTDNDGFFEIKGLPDGSGNVQASIQNGQNRRNMSNTVDIASGMTTEVTLNFKNANSSVEGYILVGENEAVQGSVSLRINTNESTESRYMETGQDGRYFFEELPAGTLTLRAYGQNIASQKRTTAALADGEQLRLDLKLFGGTTIRLVVQNVPTNSSTMIILLPNNYDVPSDLTESNMNEVFGNAIQTAGIQQGGTTEFANIDPGNYTVVAISYNPTSQGRPDYANALMTSKSITVQSQNETDVALSF